jgi:DNA-binding PadR family transcriptional regulator
MFGPGFWEHPRHGGGRRRFKRGMLRWIVLKMLEAGERHGYDFLSFFQMRGWSPGAGSIYPLLASLESEGLVQGRDENGRRVYTITDEGRRRLREDAPPWFRFEEIFESEGPRVNDEMQAAFDRLAAAWAQAKQVAKPETLQKIAETLDKTRKEIYAVLADE